MLAGTSTRSRLLPRVLLLLVGTGVGVGLLILLLRSVNLDELGTDFGNVDYRFLALSALPFAVILLLKVTRWELLYGADAPSWDTLFGAINVGYAINSLLPLRLGEVVRAYWVRDRAGISMVRTLSTIALERVMDGVTLVLLFVLTAPTVAFPRRLLGSALVIGALFVVALIVMVILALGPIQQGRFPGIFRRLEDSRWSFAAQAVGQALSGLHALRNRRAIVLLFLYTIIIWMTNALMTWLVLRAFHIAAPFTAGVLLTAVLSLGMSVPSSPGYVGVFDYLMVVTLGLYNVPRTPAVAAALGFHIVGFAPPTIIGLLYIGRAGVETTLRMLRAGATDSAQT